MAFRYLDDVTAADIAFQARGESLEELFLFAWEATMRVMVVLPGDPEDSRGSPGAPEDEHASRMGPERTPGRPGRVPEPQSEALVPRLRRRIRLEAAEPDLLLHDLLEELVYLKDAESLLLLLDSCRVEQEGGRWLLEAVAIGERIDPERHRLGVDVKAVTWHRFEVSQHDGGWQATVVLDV